MMLPSSSKETRQFFVMGLKLRDAKVALHITKMRILGRILLELRTNCDMVDGNLKDFLRPDFFDSVVKCTKQL